jgi:hypothetical protein
MKTQIRPKKVTVSKPRNIISFIFNIVTVSYIGLAAIMFLVSAMVFKFDDTYSGYLMSSFFGTRYQSSFIMPGTTEFALAGFIMLIFGYIFFC